MAEILTVALSAALLMGYHLRLWRLVLNAPHKASFGRHRTARKVWVAQYAGVTDGILVVQTLRNWLMSASFLASTAILLALGLLGIITTTDKISGFAAELNIIGDDATHLFLGKFLLLAINFMVAFFMFSFSVRFLTHAGFTLSVASAGTEAEPARSIDGSRDLERGALFYFIGLRLYYVAIPLTMWLLGPLWMLVGTIVLVAALYVID